MFFCFWASLVFFCTTNPGWVIEPYIQYSEALFVSLGKYIVNFFCHPFPRLQVFQALIEMLVEMSSFVGCLAR